MSRVDAAQSWDAYLAALAALATLDADQARRLDEIEAAFHASGRRLQHDHDVALQQLTALRERSASLGNKIREFARSVGVTGESTGVGGSLRVDQIPGALDDQERRLRKAIEGRDWANRFARSEEDRAAALARDREAALQLEEARVRAAASAVPVQPETPAPTRGSRRVYLVVGIAVVVVAVVTVIVIVASR